VKSSVFAVFRHWFCSLLILASLMVGVVASPTAQADNSQKALSIYNIAQQGQFEQLLEVLEPYRHKSQQIHSLVFALERYGKHQAERQVAKLDSFNEALTLAEEEFNNDKIEDALRAAIEAHSLAENQAALLESELVTTLVESAENQAKQAEADKDWLYALSLYRLLDMLFEDHPTHREDVDRIASHVRVIQVYTPETLEHMFRERAEAKGIDRDDADVEVEHQSWEERLKGVELSMLRDAIARSARRHVDASGYTSLMLGSVQGLQVMLNTPRAYEEFPTLKDEEQRANFSQYLERVAKSLTDRDEDDQLNFLEAATMIDRVDAMNRVTVKLPKSVVAYEMAEGAMGTLDDFSAVIWPHDIEQFQRSTQGKFTGVGIQITRRDGQLMCVTPLEGTPAQQAGMKAGDLIIAVDGESTASWTLDRAVRQITGPEGTTVTLTVERRGRNEPLDIPIVRAEIVIESIRGWEHTDRALGGWNYFVDAEDRIAYVRMTQFIPQTVEALDQAIEEMQKTGPINGLVLDLRHNPGGLLKSAIDVVDRFIDEGDIVATVEADGARNNQAQANRFNTYESFPVVILINQGSASASEIVSGALQDHGRATIIGTRSFGKGSVQDIYRLANGRSFLKLTTQYYQLPGGRIIHRKDDSTMWGVEPDLVVDVTDRQVADLLEFRQSLDIIRDEDEPIMADATKPWASDTFRVNEGKIEVEGTLPDGSDRVMVEVNPPMARQIIELGLDPQLEAAVLLLKTRLVAQEIAEMQGQAIAQSSPEDEEVAQ